MSSTLWEKPQCCLPACIAPHTPTGPGKESSWLRLDLTAPAEPEANHTPWQLCGQDSPDFSYVLYCAQGLQRFPRQLFVLNSSWAEAGTRPGQTWHSCTSTHHIWACWCETARAAEMKIERITTEKVEDTFHLSSLKAGKRELCAGVPQRGCGPPGSQPVPSGTLATWCQQHKLCRTGSTRVLEFLYAALLMDFSTQEKTGIFSQ